MNIEGIFVELTGLYNLDRGVPTGKLYEIALLIMYSFHSGKRATNTLTQ